MTVQFVSGIDTDAGKTIVTGWLARRLADEGRRIVTAKLVQTGSDELSPDILTHRRLMGTGLFPEDREGLTMPETFRYPASPHLAAELDGRPVDFPKIEKAVATLAERFESVLVEGAGGLMVPLTRECLTIDYVAARGWPVWFVTSGKLGSVNHTLLSLEALKRRNMPLAGMVFNDWCPSHDPVIADDTRAYLRGALQKFYPDAPFLVCPTLAL